MIPALAGIVIAAAAFALICVVAAERQHAQASSERPTPRGTVAHRLVIQLPRAFEGLPIGVAEVVILARLDGHDCRVERHGTSPTRVTVRPAPRSDLEQHLAGTCGLFRALPTGEWVWQATGF